MVAADTNRNSEISLSDYLARRARSSTDARLIVDAVTGFVVASASLLAQGPVWYLFVSAGLCFLSFGAWGIADRELGERTRSGRATRGLIVARIVSSVVGYVAVVFLVLGALGVALGRIIS
ncbi:MAG: hypothetical protein ABIR92_12250 [Gemmatimonadaceae bacterium]